MPASLANPLLADGDPMQILVMSAALLACLIVLFAAVAWLRKWSRRPDESLGTGFTLADLRQLHRSGQMTDEEFERAKAKIIQSAQAAAQRLNPTKPTPPKDRP